MGLGVLCIHMSPQSADICFRCSQEAAIGEAKAYKSEQRQSQGGAAVHSRRMRVLGNGFVSALLNTMVGLDLCCTRCLHMLSISIRGSVSFSLHDRQWINLYFDPR